MPYTLGQAAKATGKSKSTLQVAIKKGRISASQDDLGQYQIDPAELHRVYPPRSLTDRQTGPQSEQDKTLYLAEKDAQLRELKGRLEVMEQLCHQLEGERDRERQNHDDTKRQLMALLPAPKAAGQKPEAGKRGFLWRLWPFG